MSQWYEKLFENYAEKYDQEVFTQGTIAEVDFIEQEIGFDKTKRILDIGCGTGRHAIELACRGYSVTGIDLSESQLKRAREKAEKACVTVEFLQKDARQFSFESQFDMAIMLCEGAFSLMETDEMNFRILQNAVQSLKSGSKFIFTCLNVLYPLYHSVKDFINQNSEVASLENNFDLLTFRDFSTIEIVDDAGEQKKIDCNERYFAPSEISWYLKSLDCMNIGIYGCDTGIFSRDKKLTTDDFEMLVVAEKRST